MGLWSLSWPSCTVLRRFSCLFRIHSTCCSPSPPQSTSLPPLHPSLSILCDLGTSVLVNIGKLAVLQIQVWFIFIMSITQSLKRNDTFWGQEYYVWYVRSTDWTTGGFVLMYSKFFRLWPHCKKYFYTATSTHAHKMKVFMK